ncbi:MAG: FMN-dependent NADH-azoreductase [Gammaproteobacteria bacterium]
MKRLTLVHTSLNGTKSLSSSLAKEYASTWKTQHSDSMVTEIEFATTPIPHLTAETFGAFVTPPEERSAEQRDLVAPSDKLIEQLKASDELVLAVPMYNFGVPSQLRAYFDHIARAGTTFRYTPNGPEGLVELEKVTVIATRGGRYAGTELDTQTTYLTNFFNFIGVSNIDFIYAEGTAMGEESLTSSINEARRSINATAIQSD